MKSTYKILTVDLDRKPFAKNVPVKIWTAKEENLFGLEAEYNLFDYPYSKRVVFGTMLLMEKLQSISNRINQLEFINELIIKIDYYSSLPVINRLFLRRILQAIDQLQKKNPNIVFVIMAEEEYIGKVKSQYEQMKNQIKYS